MEAGRARFSSHLGPLNADESVSHLENGVHRPCLSNVFTVKKQVFLSQDAGPFPGWRDTSLTETTVKTN